jgi:hypothetical protein
MCVWYRAPASSISAAAPNVATPTPTAAPAVAPGSASTASASSSSAGAIGGGVVGGLFGAALVVGGAVYLYSRQAAKLDDPVQLELMDTGYGTSSSAGQVKTSLGHHGHVGPEFHTNPLLITALPTATSVSPVAPVSGRGGAYLDELGADTENDGTDLDFGYDVYGDVAGSRAVQYLAGMQLNIRANRFCFCFRVLVCLVLCDRSKDSILGASQLRLTSKKQTSKQANKEL